MRDPVRRGTPTIAAMLEPGLSASVRTVVTTPDTAASLGSGDVNALATPRLIALCEEATVAAVTPHLQPSQTTVGTRVEIAHLAASAVGTEVIVMAVLDGVDRNLLHFSVEASDGARKLAVGSVDRTIVDLQRFEENLQRAHQ